jgi:hypothetical protein
LKGVGTMAVFWAVAQDGIDANAASIPTDEA